MDKETNELLKEISDAKNIIVSKKRELKNHLLKVAKERLEGAVIIDKIESYKVSKVKDVDVDDCGENLTVRISGKCMDKKGHPDLFNTPRLYSYTVDKPTSIKLSIKRLYDIVKDDNVISEFDARYKQAKKAFENMYDQYGNFIRPHSSVCVTIDGKVKKGYIKSFDKESMKYEVFVPEINQDDQCSTHWLYGKELIIITKF